MSDKPPDKTKESVSKEVFEKELHRVYGQVANVRLECTKQKICELLDFIEERQMKWTKKRINDTLHDMVDNQIPKSLQETPLQYTYVNNNGLTQQNGTNIASSSYDNDYNLLTDAHSFTNHGNVDSMINYAEQRNISIPKPAMVAFLQLCKYCRDINFQRRAALIPSQLPPKPAMVNLITFPVKLAGNFKWILHYCDLNMKRSALHQLYSNTAEQVAYALLNNFRKTGYPTILYSDGSDLFTEAHKKLLGRSPICKIIQFQHCHKSAMDKICEDIMKLIQDWRVENESVSWSFALRCLNDKVKCIFDESMLKDTPQALSEEYPLTLNEEPANCTNKNKEVEAETLDERAEDKGEDIKENCGNDISTNALGNLNLALSE